MGGESPAAGGFRGRESVALLLTHLLFGAIPHASVNMGENLVSAGSQPLAMCAWFRLSVFRGLLGYFTREKCLRTLPL